LRIRGVEMYTPHGNDAFVVVLDSVGITQFKTLDGCVRFCADNDEQSWAKLEWETAKQIQKKLGWDIRPAT